MPLGLTLTMMPISVSNTTGLKVKGGDFVLDDGLPYRKFLHSKFKALVAGADFDINVDGSVEKRKCQELSTYP